MKNLDWLSRIGGALQARMSYADISAYLSALGVGTNKPTSGINDKWVYIKERSRRPLEPRRPRKAST